MVLGVLASRKMGLRDPRRLHKCWGHNGCCWDMMWRRKYSAEDQGSTCPLLCPSPRQGAMESNGRGKTPKNITCLLSRRMVPSRVEGVRAPSP